MTSLSIKFLASKTDSDCPCDKLKPVRMRSWGLDESLRCQLKAHLLAHISHIPTGKFTEKDKRYSNTTH